jgi:hypothetical protein
MYTGYIQVSIVVQLPFAGLEQGTVSRAQGCLPYFEGNLNGERGEYTKLRNLGKNLRSSRHHTHVIYVWFFFSMDVLYETVSMN